MYLGLDVGTSGIKGVVVNQAGEVVASHIENLTISRPNPGWSEQNPEDWINASCAVLTQLKDFLPLVQSIGLSGQMHGATCLDYKNNIIRPCILWNDTRSQQQAENLNNQENLKQIFGNLTFAGFTAPKILWMREFEPENYKKIHKVLLPKDYLRFWLSGEYVSDISDSSGTAWLNPQTRNWSDELLNASGLSVRQMPKLIEGSFPSATIKDSIAEKFNLPKNTIIAGGGGDNAASAIGLDIIAPKTAFISLGTSGVVFVSNKQFFPNPNYALHSFAHCIPNTWHQMGVTLCATDCLNWLAKQLNHNPIKLIKGLSCVDSPSSELFLPFLGGERTPYNSAKLQASFHCLNHKTDNLTLTKAVLEGVCFSLKQCVELIEKSGEKINQFLAIGGGSSSDYWLNLLATILNKPVLRTQNSKHCAAIGAARLGAMSVGKDIILKKEQVEFIGSKHSDEYQKKYQQYLKIAQFENSL